MKIGAAFLISLATAQDYGLDGADVNAAAFDSDYNYDGKYQGTFIYAKMHYLLRFFTEQKRNLLILRELIHTNLCEKANKCSIFAPQRPFSHPEQLIRFTSSSRQG